MTAVSRNAIFINHVDPEDSKLTIWRGSGRGAPRSQRRTDGGNFGDSTAVSGGVSELWLDYGPGYRIFCRHRRLHRVVLLCGGDRSSQSRDTKQARTLAGRGSD